MSTEKSLPETPITASEMGATKGQASEAANHLVGYINAKLHSRPKGAIRHSFTIDSSIRFSDDAVDIAKKKFKAAGWMLTFADWNNVVTLMSLDFTDEKANQ